MVVSSSKHEEIGSDNDTISLTSTILSTHSDNEFFEVEKILAENPESKTATYLIKWKGYPISRATWEPRKQICHLRAVINTWRQRQKQEDCGLKKSFDTNAWATAREKSEDERQCRKIRRLTKRKRLEKATNLEHGWDLQTDASSKKAQDGRDTVKALENSEEVVKEEPEAMEIMEDPVPLSTKIVRNRRKVISDDEKASEPPAQETVLPDMSQSDRPLLSFFKARCHDQTAPLVEKHLPTPRSPNSTNIMSNPSRERSASLLSIFSSSSGESLAQILRRSRALQSSSTSTKKTSTSPVGKIQVSTSVRPSSSSSSEDIPLAKRRQSSYFKRGAPVSKKSAKTLKNDKDRTLPSNVQDKCIFQKNNDSITLSNNKVSTSKKKKNKRRQKSKKFRFPKTKGQNKGLIENHQNERKDQSEHSVPRRESECTLTENATTRLLSPSLTSKEVTIIGSQEKLYADHGLAPEMSIVVDHNKINHDIKMREQFHQPQMMNEDEHVRKEEKGTSKPEDLFYATEQGSSTMEGNRDPSNINSDRSEEKEKELRCLPRVQKDHEQGQDLCNHIRSGNTLPTHVIDSHEDNSIHLPEEINTYRDLDIPDVLLDPEADPDKSDLYPLASSLEAERPHQLEKKIINPQTLVLPRDLSHMNQIHPGIDHDDFDVSSNRKVPNSFFRGQFDTTNQSDEAYIIRGHFQPFSLLKDVEKSNNKDLVHDVKPSGVMNRNFPSKPLDRSYARLPKPSTPITDLALSSTTTKEVVKRNESKNTASVVKEVVIGSECLDTIQLDFGSFEMVGEKSIKIAIESTEKIYFDQLCIAQDFQKQHYLLRSPILWQENISTVDPRNQDAASTIEIVFNQLVIRSAGLIAQIHEFMILLFPVKREEWRFIDQSPEGPPEFRLRYSIFSNNLTDKQPNPPYFCDKKTNQLVRTSHEPKKDLLTELLNDFIPRLENCSHLSKCYLLFPPAASRMAEFVNYCLNIVNLNVKVYGSMTEGSWDHFHKDQSFTSSNDSVEENNSKIVLIHELAVTELFRIPRLSNTLNSTGTIFWQFSDGFSRHPLYPSLDFAPRPRVGDINTTELFPYGCAILLTPSFLVAEPKAAFELIRWLALERTQMQIPNWRIVGAHDLPSFMLDVAKSKASEAASYEKRHAKNPKKKIVLRERLLDYASCNTRWRLFYELYKIDEKTLKNRESEIDAESYLLQAPSMINPDNEHELIRWFAAWSLMNSDVFRKFIVIGTGPLNVSHAKYLKEFPLRKSKPIPGSKSALQSSANMLVKNDHPQKRLSDERSNLLRRAESLDGLTLDDSSKREISHSVQPSSMITVKKSSQNLSDPIASSLNQCSSNINGDCGKIQSDTDRLSHSYESAVYPNKGWENECLQTSNTGVGCKATQKPSTELKELTFEATLDWYQRLQARGNGWEHMTIIGYPEAFQLLKLSKPK